MLVTRGFGNSEIGGVTGFEVDVVIDDEIVIEVDVQTDFDESSE